MRLQSAFPDERQSICSVFFASTDISDKTWCDLDTLANSDETTFWTVVTQHPRLPAVLAGVFDRIDRAHHSTSPATRRSVTKSQVQSVARVILRLSCESDECLRRNVDVADLAKRISTLLPLPSYLVFNIIAAQANGALASLAGYSLHMLSPTYLCAYGSFMLEWREIIDRTAKLCVRELAKGRYQRLSGDILILFEQTYRAVKQIWALLLSCPFTADYLAPSILLRSLRIVTDVISPMLQHFLMTCDALTARREVLSKANAGIINAALQASTAFLLFRGYTAEGNSEWQWLHASVMRRVEERVVEMAEMYVFGYPAQLFSSWGPNPSANASSRGSFQRGGLFKLFRSLYPPPSGASGAEKDRSIGGILLALMDPRIPESGDFAAAIPKRQRFFELLLVQIVQQGVHIDDLLQRRMMTPNEAEELGASQQAVLCALAGISLTDDAIPSASVPAPGAAAPSAKAPSPPPKKETRPPVFEEFSLAAMVHDVFPQFSALGIEAALQHYHNDVEQLITDASMDNLPPHIMELMGVEDDIGGDDPGCGGGAMETTGMPERLEFDVSQLSPSAAVEQLHLSNDDYDETLQLTDLSLFYWDADAVSGNMDSAHEGAAEDFSEDYYTITEDSIMKSSGFAVSEEMRERIRILNDIIYDDELDDGQADTQYLNKNHRLVQESSSDDEDEPEEHAAAALPREEGEDGAAVVSSTAEGGRRPLPYNLNRPPPRSEYDNKLYQKNRERSHKKDVKEKQAARAAGDAGGEGAARKKPAYAEKEKSKKQVRSVRSGKADAARYVKKLN